MNLPQFNQAIMDDDCASVDAMLSSDPTLVNRADENGRTPIDLAVSRAGKPLVELLINRGAIINKDEKLFGTFPLLQTVARSRPEILELLVKRGADVNAKDNDGQTALHLAVSLDHKDMARLLLAHGANPHAVDKKGETPVSIAKQHEDDNKWIRLLSQASIRMIDR